MNDYDAILAQVTEILVDSLAVEPEEVVPDARFFDDLGGESLDVLDLTFKCEKEFGRSIRFQDLIDRNATEAGDGRMTTEDIDRLQSRFPFLDLQSAREAAPVQAFSLFTVDTIVRLIQHSPQTDASHAAPSQSKSG